MAELKATVMQSGGDYTTVDACFDGEAQDLTDGGGDTFIIEISGSWSVDDTVDVYHTGWTTNATCFITITAIGSARHTGKWTTTAHRLRGNGRRIFGAEDYTVWDGLQIANTSTGTQGEVSTIYITGMNETIKNCIVRKDGDTDVGNQFGIRFANSSNTFKAYNNLVYDFINSGTHDIGIRMSSSAAGCIVSNNTIINCIYGIYADSGDCLARNNLIYNCTNQTNSTTFANNTGYNSTNDSSFEYTVNSGGGNDRVNQTFTFVAAGSDDYHLQSSDAGAKDYGVDLSSLFTIDIDGDTRSTPWDIGMDDVVSGATAHEKALDDTITITSSMSKLVAIKYDESISVSDIPQKLSKKNINALITVSDLLRMFTLKNINESININDSISKAIIISLLETISVTEEFEKIIGIIEKLLIDTITVTDEISNFNIYKQLTDAININDMLNKHSLIKFLETISISDEINFSTILEKILTDIITVTSELGNFNIEKNLNENITVNGIIKKYIEILISDNVNINESFTAIRVVIAGYVLLKNITMLYPSTLNGLIIQYNGNLIDIIIIGGN